MEEHSSCRTDQEWDDLYKRNVDRVYRICYMHLKNTADAEDAVQSIFLKVLKSNVSFSDLNQEKAWLIIITKNHCKDIWKSWWKTRRVDLEMMPELSSTDTREQHGELLEKLLSLPRKYKIVLYLYYYEGYSVKEIAALLEIKESTIQTQLATGRKRLKYSLGGTHEEHSYS